MKISIYKDDSLFYCCEQNWNEETRCKLCEGCPDCHSCFFCDRCEEYVDDSDVSACGYGECVSCCEHTYCVGCDNYYEHVEDCGKCEECCDDRCQDCETCNDGPLSEDRCCSDCQKERDKEEKKDAE